MDQKSTLGYPVIELTVLGLKVGQRVIIELGEDYHPDTGPDDEEDIEIDPPIFGLDAPNVVEVNG